MIYCIECKNYFKFPNNQYSALTVKGISCDKFDNCLKVTIPKSVMPESGFCHIVNADNNCKNFEPINTPKEDKYITWKTIKTKFIKGGNNENNTKLLGNNKETMIRYLDFLNTNINIKCVYQVTGCDICGCTCDKFVDVDSQSGIKLLNIYDEGIKAHNDTFMRHWKKVWNV